mgnify:CR=1 FL=1
MDLILFDMDHTLLDADKAHIDSFIYAFREANLGNVNPEKIKPLFGLIGYKIVKKLFPKLTIEECKKINELKYKHLMKFSKRYMKPLPGIITALNKLKKHYHLAVITNCRTKEIPVLLKEAGINVNLFEILVGNDLVKHPKPAPDEIFKAEAVIHHKASYMIGDSIYDMLAGKRAGVKTIGVLTGHTSKAKLKKYKPLAILKSVAELPKFLLEKKR